MKNSALIDRYKYRILVVSNRIFDEDSDKVELKFDFIHDFIHYVVNYVVSKDELEVICDRYRVEYDEIEVRMVGKGPTEVIKYSVGGVL